MASVREALSEAGCDPTDRQGCLRAALRVARMVEHLMGDDGRRALVALERCAKGETPEDLAEVLAIFRGPYLLNVDGRTTEAVTRRANLAAGGPLEYAVDPHPEAPVDAVQCAWHWAMWPLAWEMDGFDADVNTATGEIVRRNMALAICGERLV